LSTIIGENIWITGASSGIGKSLALAMADELPQKIVLSARNLERLNDLKSALVGKGVPSHNIYTLQFDLANEGERLNAYQQLVEKKIHIDILINNGGVSQRSQVVDTSLEVYKEIMDVNFFASIHLTKLLLDGMLQRGHGHILVVSSLVGKFGTPLRSGYSASKHALHGFYEALRHEVHEKGIRITLFCPGYVKTDISINAVDGKGGKHNIMDDNQKNGLSPDKCARQIIKAIKRDKEEAYFAHREIFGVYLKRFAPKIFSKLIRKMKVNDSQ